MADCYTLILQETGLNGTSSGGEGHKESALFCLLTALSAADSRGNTYANPIRELIEVRLASVKETPFVKEFVRPYLNSHVSKFGAY
jgi:hypothetical protein